MTDLSFEALAPEYEKLWATCTILPSRKSAADLTASRILANKDRYVTVEQATTVPWFVIGLIHAMEGGLNFKTHLHNGDPLTARTRQVPRGRPKVGNPPFTWEESAIDALTMDGLDKVTDWTPQRLCFELEGYNGWGYQKFHSNVNTPYLWSGTNNYTRGKYIADGKWDPNAISGQSGAVAILKCVMTKDNDVVAALEPDTVVAVVDNDPSATLGPSLLPTPVTAGELAAQSRGVGFLMQIKAWAMKTIFGGSGGTAMSLSDLNEQVKQGHTLMQAVAAEPLLIGSLCAVLFGVSAWAAAHYLVGLRLQDVFEGRYIPSKAQGA